MIFAVFDVLLAVNMCINYSFLQLFLFKGHGQVEGLLKITIRATVSTVHL